MKNSDTYELFEVFKPGVMDGPFYKKLAYWFKNVYWYHFKTQTCLVIAALILVGVFIGDIVNRVNNDLDYIIAGNTAVTHEQMEALTEFFSAHMPDINDDKRVTVGYQMLCTGEDSSGYNQYAMASEKKLEVSLADDTYLLYILDQAHMEDLAAQGAFEPLETFNIQSENKYCVRVDNSKLFKKFGIESNEQGGWYVGLKVIGEQRARDQEIMKKYNAAAGLIEQLMVGA